MKGSLIVKLIWILILISWSGIMFGQNYYCYFGLEKNTTYTYQVYVTYDSGSGDTFELSKTNSVDNCYDFLKTNEIYGHFTCYKKPESFTLQRRLSSSSGDWHEYTLIDYNDYYTTYNLLTPDNTNSTNSCKLYVDAPVRILKVTEYQASKNINEICLDNVYRTSINTSAQLNKHGIGGKTYQLYTKSNTWVDFKTNFYDYDLVNSQYRPNEQIKLKVKTQRLIPGSNSYIQYVENEFTGGIFYESLSGCSAYAVKVCSNENNKIGIILPEARSYVITLEEVTDPIHEGVGGCFIRTATKNNDTVYIESKVSKPAGMDDPIQFDGTKKIKIYVELNISGVDLDPKSSPPVTRCAYESEDLTIPGKLPIPKMTYSHTDYVCINDKGSINLNALEGNGAPYMLHCGPLSKEAANDTFTNLSDGNYEVYVEDREGCKSGTESISIDKPDAALSATAAESIPATCHVNNNGTIDDAEIWVNAEGGWGSYVYAVDSEDYDYDDPAVGGITSGLHTIKVKDANGCIFSIPDVSVSSTIGELSISASKLKDEVCAGANNGEISYSKNGSGTVSLTGATLDAANSKFTGVKPGTNHKVRITNSTEGCYEESDAVTVVSYTNPILESADIGTVDALCYNGNGTISVNNVVKGSYNNTEVGFKNVVITDGDSTWTEVFNGSYSAKKYPDAFYDVYVVDSNDCVSGTIKDKKIAEPSDIAMTLNSISNVTCKGNKNGIIKVEAKNATIDYKSFTLYDTNDKLIKQFLNKKENEDVVFDGLSPASYKLTIIDKNNCPFTKSTIGNVSLVISEPKTKFAVDLDSVHPTCSDKQDVSVGKVQSTNGQVIIKPTGGWHSVDPDKYKISVVNNSTTITDDMPNNNLALSDNKYTHSKRAKGVHTYSVIDGGGCTITKSIEVKYREEVQFESVFFKHQKCAYSKGLKNENGIISVKAKGGNSSIYSYYLTENSIHDPNQSIKKYEMITDGKSRSFSGIVPGSYSLIVLDSEKCKLTANNQTIEDYSNPSIDDIKQDSVKCHGDPSGKIIITKANPGIYGNDSKNTVKVNTIKNYWAKPSTNPKVDVLDYEADLEFSGLPYNYFYLEAIDDSNCVSAHRGKQVLQPPKLFVDSLSIVDSVNCKGEKNAEIFFQIGGGTGTDKVDLLYRADIGSDTFIETDEEVDSKDFFSDLGHGKYYIHSSDYHNCTINTEALIINEPAATLLLDYELLDSVRCHKNDKALNSFLHSNGKVKLKAKGGWDIGYYFDIKKFESDKDEWALFEPICDSLAYWDDYIIQVRDSGGCVDTMHIEVPQPTPISITSSIFSHEICAKTDTGKIIVSASGSHAPYSFVLDSTSGYFVDKVEGISKNVNHVFTGLKHTQYRIKVEDDSSCYRYYNDLEVKEYINPKLNQGDLSLNDWVHCYGESNGILKLSKMGRGYNRGGKDFPFDTLFITGRYSDISRIISSFPETNNFFKELPCDRYDIQVKDSNNCISNLINDTVLQPDSLILTILHDSIVNETCYGDTNGVLPFRYSGGNNSFYLPDVLWKIDSSITPAYQDTTFWDLAKGDYFLRITDYRGCTDTASAFIDGPDDSVRITFKTTLVDCHIKDSGDHYNGTISVKAINGYDPKIDPKYNPYTFAIRLDDSSKYTRYQTDTLFANLPVGIDTIKVIDHEGCDHYTFPIEVESNDSLTFKTYLFDEVCEDTKSGKIIVATEGGAGKHKYHINKSDTNGFNPLPSFVAHQEDSAIFTDLPPSFAYQITVTDTNQCFQRTTANSLPIHEYFNPEIKQGNIWFDSVHCYGEKNGSVQLHGNYGWHNSFKIEYDSIFVWDSSGVEYFADHIDEPIDFGGFFTDTSFLRNDFHHGQYTFVVKDDSACESKPINIFVEQPDTLLLYLKSQQHVIAKGEDSGILKFATTGGNKGIHTLKAFNSLNQTYQTENILQNTKLFEWQGFVADTFTVQVNDYHNCLHEIDSIIVKEPEFPLTFSVSEKNDALCKASVGNFMVSAHGGWGDYEFQGAGRNSYYDDSLFVGLYAGHYFVTVKDSMGATFTDTVVLYEPGDSLKVLLTTIQDPTCGDNGVLTYQMEGGTAPYRLTYVPKDTFNVWSPYEYSAKDLSEGYYRAAVFDSNNCQFDVEATLTGDLRLNIEHISIKSYATVDTLPGNGVLKASVSGGTNNTYNWYASNDTLTSLSDTTYIKNRAPGLYVFKAESSEGCLKAESMFLPHMYDHPMGIKEIGHERGYNTKDGYVICNVPIDTATTVILKHETKPDVTYDLSANPGMYNHNEHTLQIVDLDGGDYIIIITDTTDRVAFADFHINTYEQFAITSELLVDVIKHDEANGSIQVGCKGGAGNNSFTWVCDSDPSRTLTPKSTEYSTLMDSIQAGTYSLTITDANNHELHGTYTLQNPPPIVMSYEKFDVNCKDSSDGYVDLSVTGGWGNFQFKVDTAENYANSKKIFDLEARTYYFYTVDKRGAVDSILVVVGEPDYLRSAVRFVDSVNCYGESNGIIYFDVNGGTQPYAYVRDSNKLLVQDTIDYNLAATQYTYRFTDSNSCTGIDTLVVDMPQPDSLYIRKINYRQATCGFDNASMAMEVTGGTNAYRYQWTNGAGAVVGNEAYMDSLVQQEQYYFVAFDYNNCFTKHEQQINRSIPPRVDSLMVNPVICYGDSTGSVEIGRATAGAPAAPYWFEWSNADTGTVANGYAVGDYFVTIKDTNNCKTNRWFYMPQPDSLHAVLTGFNHVKCFGIPTGYIKVKAKGGVGNYTYNWNTNDTLNELDSLYRGVYALNLRDSNNCVFTDTFNITEPEQLRSVVDSVEHLKCKGDKDGKINFELSGGTCPYRYKLTDNTYWLKGSNAGGLPEGSYIWHFTDANDCISPDTLTVGITAPDSLLFSNIDITHTTCNTHNGSIGVSAKGGVQPYRYKWTDTYGNLLDTTAFIDSLQQLALYRITIIDSNKCKISTVKQIDHSTVPKVLSIDTKPVLCWGDTTGSAAVVKVDTAFPPAPVRFVWSNGDEGESSERFFEGNHFVVVSDTNGCESKRYFTVTSPKPLEGHLMAYNEPSCNGDDDGSMEIYPEGGVGCYAITWSDGNKLFLTDSIAAGWYSYVLSDSNGCIFEDNLELTEPEILKSKVTNIDSIMCPGDRNGRITFNVMGGTEPYYYRTLGDSSWIRNTKVYQLATGVYSYEFTDAHTCIGVDTLVVDMVQPDTLAFDSLNVQHTTCAQDNGSIFFTMKGGTKPYNYVWMNTYREFLSNENFIDSLKQDQQYWLEVSDKRDCKFKFDTQIKRSSGPRIEQISTTEVLCSDEPTGKAFIDSVKPATPFSPYRIEWSNGDKGDSTNRYFAGQHFATVIDSNGCRSVRYFDITQPNPLMAELIDYANATCYNDTNGYLNVRATGGAESYKALWTHGDTNLVAKSLGKGIYSVVITDTNDCKIEQTYEITEPDSILIDIGEGIEICPSSVYTLDGFEYKGHEWLLDTTFFSDEQYAHVSEAGTYTLTVTNENGCKGSDSFVLTIGNSALKPDFLMTSEAFLGDTLHVMELSNLPLDSMRWTYNTDAFVDKTLEDDPDYLLRLKTFLTGMYSIELEAHSGGCVATKIKTVDIVEMSDTSDTFTYLGYNPLIKSLVVTPNPTSGEFKAKITLREKADIQLTVYGVDYGKKIDIREKSGYDYYEIPYNIGNEQSGMYVLVVTASNERKQSKIILQ